jgi:hypothetical protein
VADNYTYFAQDDKGTNRFGWDGKAWVDLAAQPGAMQTKPGGPILNATQQQHPIRAIPRTILESFGIDADKVEQADSFSSAATGAAGDVANNMGESMFEGLVKTGPLAPVHMLAQGIDGAQHQIRNGSTLAYQSYKSGDKYNLSKGLTQVAAGLGQLAAMKGEAEPIKKSTAALVEAPRSVARMPLGINSAAEADATLAHNQAMQEIAEKNHKTVQENTQATSEARQTHEDAVRKIEEANTKAQADYEATKRRNEAQYQRDKQKFDQARAGESLTSQGKGKRPAMATEAAGSTRQRLQAWSDRVGEITSKTQAAIKDSFNKRYSAFRDALGPDPQVNWTPAQEAVKYAEDNILQGSPESIALFRNIIKEGPQLDEASVFKTGQRVEAAQNLADIYKRANPAMKRGIEANLAKQGLTVNDLFREEGGTAPPQNTITQGLKIPHSDAWGYAQELNGKLHGARLPSDVYRALKYVKEEGIDPVLQEAADAKGQGEAWKKLQGDYSEFAQRFLDKDSPAFKLMEATNPDSKLSIIVGREGQNLIDILHKYRGFGGEPEVAGKVRALRAASAKSAPTLEEPTRQAPPAEPTPKPLPTEAKYPAIGAPKPNPSFDPEAWKQGRLLEYQQRLASRQPTTMWQFLQLPYFRALSRLYSNPAFVKLVLGMK